MKFNLYKLILAIFIGVLATFLAQIIIFSINNPSSLTNISLLLFPIGVSKDILIYLYFLPYLTIFVSYFLIFIISGFITKKYLKYNNIFYIVFFGGFIQFSIKWLPLFFFLNIILYIFLAKIPFFKKIFTEYGNVKKNKYIIIPIFFMVLFGVICGMYLYKMNYLYKGWDYVVGDFGTDLYIVEDTFKEAEISNYETFFDNFRKENSIINISLVSEKLTGKDESNGIKDNFILEGYKEKCFYFRIPINEFKGMQYYIYRGYGKNKNFTDCDELNEKNDCYVIFTEKGLLRKNDFYECK